MILTYSDESIAVSSISDLRLLIGSSEDELIFKFSKDAWLNMVTPYKTVTEKSSNHEAFVYLLQKLISLEAEGAKQLQEIARKIDADKLYRQIDTKLDGFIDFIKITKVFLLTNDDIIHIFRRLDLDEDYFISYKEFIDHFEGYNKMDLYQKDHQEFCLFLHSYSELLCRMNHIQPQDYVSAYQDMLLDQQEIQAYLQFWNNISQESNESNPQIREFILQSIIAYTELTYLKTNFIERKQSSLYQIFSGFAVNNILDIRILTRQMKLYLDQQLQFQILSQLK